jgi:hypothetical protein
MAPVADGSANMTVDDIDRLTDDELAEQERRWDQRTVAKNRRVLELDAQIEELKAERARCWRDELDAATSAAVVRLARARRGETAGAA